MRRVPGFLGFAAFLAIACLAAILGGCKSGPAAVEIREVPGPTQYVKIDPKFTDHPNLPPVTGKVPPIQAPKIAAERRTLLERCYIQLDQIKAIEGTKP
jgi:hypothetical protein